MKKKMRMNRRGETILELCIALLLVVIISAITLSLTQLTSLNVNQSVNTQNRTQELDLAKKIFTSFVETYDASDYKFFVSESKKDDGTTDYILSVRKNEESTDADTVIYDTSEQKLQGIDLSSFDSVTIGWAGGDGDKLLCMTLTYRENEDDETTKIFTLYQAVRAGNRGVTE